MASASDIRAGAAYIELTLRDLASKGLHEAAQRLQSFGDSMAWAGARIAAVGATITAPLVAMAHLAVDAMADMGNQMNGEDARAARGYLAVLRVLTEQMTSLRNAVAAAVLPVLSQQAEFIGRIAARAAEWARANKDLIATVFNVGVAVVTAGVAIGFLGLVIGRIGSAIAVLSGAVTVAASIVGTLGTVLAALLTPVGAVVAGVLALGGYLLYASGLGEVALGWLGEKFRELRDDAIASWGAIADALATGDFALAGKIVWLTLKMEWQKGVNALNKIWAGVKTSMLSVWNDVVFGIARAWNNGWALVESIFVDSIAFLMGQLDGFLGKFQKGWGSVTDEIAKGLIWIQGQTAGGIDVGAAQAIIDENGRQREKDIDATNKRRSDEREKGRVKRKQEIEDERNRANDALAEAHAGKNDENQRKFDADMAAMNQELENTKAELNAARQKAGDQKREQDKNRPQLGDIGGGVGMAVERLEGRGTFNAMAVRGLGANSLAERTARASEETAGNTKRILEAWNRGVVAFQ